MVILFNEKEYVDINYVKNKYPYLHFFHDKPWIYKDTYLLCARKTDIMHNLKTYKYIYLPFNCYRESKQFTGIVCIRTTNEF